MKSGSKVGLRTNFFGNFQQTLNMFSSKVNLNFKLKLFVGLVPLKVNLKAKFLNDFVGMVPLKVNFKAKFLMIL